MTIHRASTWPSEVIQNNENNASLKIPMEKLIPKNDHSQNEKALINEHKKA